MPQIHFNQINKLIPMPEHTEENPSYNESGVAKHNLEDIPVLGTNTATPAELKAEEKRLLDEYHAEEYSRARKEEYDDLNQDEMRSDDTLNDTTTWIDAIKAIKAKWPKDNSGPV